MFFDVVFILYNIIKHIMSSNKHNLNIDVIIPMLLDGDSYRVIAAKLGVPLATLHDFCSRSTSEEGIDSNLVRVRQALDMSAQSYADKAEQTLLNAPSNMTEVMRARELSKFYMWMASKRSPKSFGNFSEVDITKTSKIIKVKGSSNSTDTES